MADIDETFWQGPHDALVGITEVAEILGVSRQRADALSRSRDFPDSIHHVIIVDSMTVRRVRSAFKAGEHQIKLNLDQAINAFIRYIDDMPQQPRLWRRSAVQEYAGRTGR